MKCPALGSVTGVIGRIPILDVEPAVDCGRRPAKAVTGETFEVSATIFREGHGLISAGVVLRDPQGGTGGRAAPSFAGGPGGSPPRIIRMHMLAPGTDRWGAEVAATSEGSWRYHVEA